MNKPSGDMLDRALTDLYQADVPAGYQAAWRDSVKREEPSDMKSPPRIPWLKRAALPLAAAAMLIIGTAVTGLIDNQTTQPVPGTADNGSATMAVYKTSGTGMNAVYGTDEEASFSAADMAYPDEDSWAADMIVAEDTPAGAGNEQAEIEQTDSRKIIRTVDLTISSTSFDQDYDTILAMTETAGGYASTVSLHSQQTEKRAASFELRIPAEALDSFLVDVEEIGRVTDRYETATDLTTQYTDTELRLKTQQDKLTRLQELLLQAENVENLLAIESEIADTQYMIDRLTSSLRQIDRQVSYTTVNLYLREQTAIDTAVTEEVTIGERIANGFKASLDWLAGFFENMLVFLTAAAPVLIPLVIVVIIVRMVRKHNKSRKQS